MEMDAAFSKALKLASKEGVHLHAYDTMVLPNELNIGKQIQVKLQ
jgi:DNA-binding sugar fermentation-stimulating protein